MSLTNIFNIAGSGMAAQSLRLNVVASNLANANSVASTPQAAYHAHEPVFSAVQQGVSMAAQAAGSQAGDAAVGVKVDGITQSNAPIQRQYEPGNPMADASGYVYGSNVNPVDELVNMISASRSYQNNVEVMNTTKQLMLKTLTLGN
jgi:flagellar basal-body rod protein FlgC